MAEKGRATRRISCFRFIAMQSIDFHNDENSGGSVKPQAARQQALHAQWQEPQTLEMAWAAAMTSDEKRATTSSRL
jgi:endo-beta-N-acetylglucosaminidase D